MADMPVLPPGTPLVDIHNTFGAIFIGCLASMTLLGMTLMQAWFYYQHFPEDPLWLKLVVVGTCVTEFLRSTFTANTVYYYLVQNWGNPAGLPVIVWSFSTIVLMTNLGELFGHFYFAWRIYMLCPRGKLRYTLSGLVVFFTLWNFGMGVSNYVALARASSLTAYAGGSQVVLAPLALATAISTDVSIAASLIFVLNRSRTGFSKTNRLINTLIFYSVQVGAITVVADAVCIGLNQFINDKAIQLDYIGVYAIIGNLYANSLLASLNARSAIKSHMNDINYLSSLQLGSTRDDSFFRSADNSTRSNVRDVNATKSRAVHLQTFVTKTVDTVDDKAPSESGTSARKVPAIGDLHEGSYAA